MIQPKNCLPMFAVAVLWCAAPVLAAPQEAADKAETPMQKRNETHNARWYVRNGLDAGAKAVAKSRPVNTTIDALTKLPAPPTVPKGKRTAPVETTLYTVTGQIVRFDKHRDGDVQFVLRDAKTGATLVGELPDPEEVAASPFGRQIAAARKAFTAHFAATATPQTLAPGAATVRVSGIGYFGAVGGAGGKDKAGAPNGVQLHPVTAFALVPVPK